MKTLIPFSLLSLLFMGCQIRKEVKNDSLDRWILPSEFRSVDSDKELPNLFRSYNGKVFVQPVQIDGAQYALVRLHANNGSSLFSCLVYEKIEAKLWQLRGCFWFYFSPTGELSVEKEGDGFFLIHDGKRLFKIISASDQVIRLREAK